MTKPKYIDIKEFRKLGFLQEANRQFFHPLGLALEVVQEECKGCGGDGRLTTPVEKRDVRCENCKGEGLIERLGGVWDDRDDPEGIAFAGPPGSMIDEAKMQHVERERQKHEGPRRTLFKSNMTIQHLYGELGAEGE